MSINKKEYKIASRYYFYGFNFIVSKIFSDKAEHLFLLFMRQIRNDNVKTWYLLAFLKEVKYANKVIHSWFEYYACKWTALPIATKYKSTINAAK